MTQIDLAALVGSRICHDLISPIGAIGNGVELLSLTGETPSAEMLLINDSVAHANARIRFFRIAYGSAGADEKVARTEICAILAAMAQGGRLAYGWQPDGEQPRALVRCAFLMLQCFETAMPLGGDITIHRDSESWSFVGQGRRITVDPDLWGSLRGQTATYPYRPAQVQFALLPGFLSDVNRKLTLDVSDTRISARF